MFVKEYRCANCASKYNGLWSVAEAMGWRIDMTGHYLCPVHAFLGSDFSGTDGMKIEWFATPGINPPDPPPYAPPLSKLDQGALDLAKVAKEIRDVKNADYGGSWERMRPASITDQILVKIERIRQLEELEARGLKPSLMSEGIESELRDCYNYIVMRWIQERERRQADGE